MTTKTKEVQSMWTAKLFVNVLPHSRLVEKLETGGIRAKVNQWIKEFGSGTEDGIWISEVSVLIGIKSSVVNRKFQCFT